MYLKKCSQVTLVILFVVIFFPHSTLGKLLDRVGRSEEVHGSEEEDRRRHRPSKPSRHRRQQKRKLQRAKGSIKSTEIANKSFGNYDDIKIEDSDKRGGHGKEEEEKAIKEEDCSDSSSMDRTKKKSTPEPSAARRRSSVEIGNCLLFIYSCGFFNPTTHLRMLPCY